MSEQFIREHGRRFSRVCLLIVPLLLFLISPLPASASIQKIGHLGNGNSFDLVESNGYLYAGQGTEVRVYDISSGSKISQLDWKDFIFKIDTDYLIEALYIDSNYLYIANTKRLVILDISNPSAPVMASYIEPLASKSAGLRDVEVRENYAFLSASGAGVLVVDISDKKNPAVAAKLKLDGYNRPRKLAISGNYLYAAMETNNRLDIIDIIDPANPSIRGSWSANAEGSLSGVAVEGSYAYVTEYHKGVHVIDISDPAKPVGIASMMGMNVNDIKILGNYAYVSIRYQGFNIIDISDPSSMEIVGKGAGIGGYIEGIFPTPEYTFLAAESKGFGIYDTSDVKEPKLAVKVPVIGGSDSVAVKDNYLYIGAHNDGIWVVDVSDPARPSEIAFINIAGRNGGVEIQDNYLFAASDWGGLNTIDITDPENPVLVVNRYGDNIDGNALPDGDYVYTSIYYPAKTLGIVSMADPAKLAYVSKLMHNISRSRFAKYGDNYLLAAVAGYNKGMNIFDISDKINPVSVSAFDSGVAYKDVAVSGNTAVALTGDGIVTLDISNIANPVLLDKAGYPGEWSGYSVDIGGNIAYAAGGPVKDIRAFDISNPSRIKLVDAFDLPENAEDIRYSDGMLYVAAGKAGIYALSAIGDSLPSDASRQPDVIEDESIDEMEADFPAGNMEEIESLKDRAGWLSKMGYDTAAEEELLQEAEELLAKGDIHGFMNRLYLAKNSLESKAGEDRPPVSLLLLGAGAITLSVLFCLYEMRRKDSLVRRGAESVLCEINAISDRWRNEINRDKVYPLRIRLERIREYVSEEEFARIEQYIGRGYFNLAELMIRRVERNIADE